MFSKIRKWGNFPARSSAISHGVRGSWLLTRLTGLTADGSSRSPYVHDSAQSLIPICRRKTVLQSVPPSGEFDYPPSTGCWDNLKAQFDYREVVKNPGVAFGFLGSSTK